MEQNNIPPSSYIGRLVPMDAFCKDFPLTIDLAYAGNACFCGPIYRKNARLWLFDDLAAIVLRASLLSHTRHGMGLILYDGLRTVNAQERMRDCPAVRAHPHWLEGPDRVLSPPGMGGHPRGMAIDVTLSRNSKALDMGTAFDEFPQGGTGPQTNRAHREYKNLSGDVKENRRRLESCMTDAAKDLGIPLLPLPVEWWDFRLPGDISKNYTALNEKDLPPQMRMTDGTVTGGPADFPSGHFEDLRKKLILRSGKDADTGGPAT